METRTYDFNEDEQDRKTFDRVATYFKKNCVSVGTNARGNQEYQKCDTTFEIDKRGYRISLYFKEEENAERAKSHIEDELNETVFVTRE